MVTKKIGTHVYWCYTSAGGFVSEAYWQCPREMIALLWGISKQLIQIHFLKITSGGDLSGLVIHVRDSFWHKFIWRFANSFFNESMLLWKKEILKYYTWVK